MRGCSKLRKATCQAEGACVWEVGKGCKKVVTKDPLPKALVSLANMKKAFRQISPDGRASKDFYDMSNKYIYFCTKYILRGNKSDTTVSDIKKAFSSKTLPKDMRTVFHDEGKRFVDQCAQSGATTSYLQHQSAFYSEQLGNTIHMLFGKTLSSDAVCYLCGGLMSLYEKVVICTSNVTWDADKSTSTVLYMKQAIEADKELSAFVKIIAFTLP